jgi:hypothetical protein
LLGNGLLTQVAAEFTHISMAKSMSENLKAGVVHCYAALR